MEEVVIVIDVALLVVVEIVSVEGEVVSEVLMQQKVAGFRLEEDH